MVTLIYIGIYNIICTFIGVTDYICPVQMEFVSDAMESYGYRGELMVDEAFKGFADAVCINYQLHYPPVSHEEALGMYLLITDECKDLS